MTAAAGKGGAFRSRTAMTLWGDGFSDDSAGANCSVSAWIDCSPDEYAVLFPRLVPRRGHMHAVPLAHLETCVAVRAWRLGGPDEIGGRPELRSVVAVDTAERHHPDWFAPEGAFAGLLRRLRMSTMSPACKEAEHRLLVLLDGILADIQRGLHPVWSEERDAWFAFGSGIHPAYLWPESALSDARGLAAAWLGHLNRGRRALMPLAVANFLLETVVGKAGCRDRQFAAMTDGAGDVARLRRAAERRLAGHDPVVMLSRKPPSHSHGHLLLRLGEGALERA